MALRWRTLPGLAARIEPSTIEHTQYAGAPARPLQDLQNAVEVMTGAVLPARHRRGDSLRGHYCWKATALLSRFPPPEMPGVNIPPPGRRPPHGRCACCAAGTRLGPAELADCRHHVGAAELRVTARPAPSRAEHRRRAGGHYDRNARCRIRFGAPTCLCAASAVCPSWEPRFRCFTSPMTLAALREGLTQCSQRPASMPWC